MMKEKERDLQWRQTQFTKDDEWNGAITRLGQRVKHGTLESGALCHDDPNERKLQFAEKEYQRPRQSHATR